MKKKLRSILALLMAVLMVAAFTACGSNGSSSSSASGGKLQEVLDRGYLIVGTGSTNAPWHFYDDNGNLCGFDVSMAKIVANSLFGDPEAVKFVEQSSDERVPNLVNGNVDICFQFMTISAERAQQIEFTIPYYTEGCEAPAAHQRQVPDRRPAARSHGQRHESDRGRSAEQLCRGHRCRRLLRP